MYCAAKQRRRWRRSNEVDVDGDDMEKMGAVGNTEAGQIDDEDGEVARALGTRTCREVESWAELAC